MPETYISSYKNIKIFIRGSTKKKINKWEIICLFYFIVSTMSLSLVHYYPLKLSSNVTGWYAAFRILFSFLNRNATFVILHVV